MFTLFVLFVFAWLFVKSVGLAFHVTWGLAKFVATLLFVIALPLLVVFAVVGALLPLLLPQHFLLPLPLSQVQKYLHYRSEIYLLLLLQYLQQQHHQKDSSVLRRM